MRLMESFRAYKKDWIKGAKSYEDFNKIHRRAFVARKYGLEGVVAPGIWTAAHIQQDGNFSSVGKIKFRGNVYSKDFIDVVRVSRGELTDYFFDVARVGEYFNGERVNVPIESRERVCEIKGVSYGKYSEAPEIFDAGEDVYNFRFPVDYWNIKNFLKSIGMSDSYVEVPNTYPLALSASSLLRLGREKGEPLGIHVSQEFEVHREFVEGKDIYVFVREMGTKRGLRFFDQQWFQDDYVRASGRAGVSQFDESDIVEIGLLRGLWIDAKAAIFPS